MEHFYHCKSLWINHDYERTPMSMWACAHARLATPPRCFVLAPQPLLTPPPPPPSSFYTFVFHVVITLGFPALPPSPSIFFFPHPSIINYASLFFFFFGAVTFKMKSFRNERLVPCTVKRTGRRMERRDQCDWISPTKPQSVITSFYGSAEQELKWLIAVCRGKLFAQ